MGIRSGLPFTIRPKIIGLSSQAVSVTLSDDTSWHLPVVYVIEPSQATKYQEVDLKAQCIKDIQEFSPRQIIQTRSGLDVSIGPL